jgi:hypothetical protein
MKLNPLPGKQAKFVDEYMLDGNGTRAAVEAGYAAGSAHVTASRLLRNERIASAVRTKRSELAAKHQVSRDQVVEKLVDAIELARIQGDPSAMIRGWTEIGKLLGYYQPDKAMKVHVNISTQREIQRLETLSDAELVAEVGRLSAL